jgi:hypothetical protein
VILWASSHEIFPSGIVLSGLIASACAAEFSVRTRDVDEGLFDVQGGVAVNPMYSHGLPMSNVLRQIIGASCSLTYCDGGWGIGAGTCGNCKCSTGEGGANFGLDKHRKLFKSYRIKVNQTKSDQIKSENEDDDEDDGEDEDENDSLNPLK